MTEQTFVIGSLSTFRPRFKAAWDFAASMFKAGLKVEVIVRERKSQRTSEQNYEQREDQWIECEDQFLRDNWGKMSLADMEHRLGRSVGAIMNRRRRLGMPTKNKAKAASKEAV